MRPGLVNRFWRKVGPPDASGCWPWLDARAREGYGTFQTGRLSSGGNLSPEMAHRVAYELTVGPIAPGMTVDHLCRNRMCVNPMHMEIVSRSENGRRGAVKTHCKRGHELAVTAVPTPNGYRACKPCRDFRNARRSAA